MNNRTNNSGQKAGAAEPLTVGGLLAAALNMEDQISGGVYDDYMSRENWPAELDEEVFRQVRERLTILIEDTKKHTRVLQALVEEYGQSKQTR
jgi:hypothetical protein